MKELESVRMKLWCDTFVAYLSTSNSIFPSSASVWADKAIEDFDERFTTTD